MNRMTLIFAALLAWAPAARAAVGPADMLLGVEKEARDALAKGGSPQTLSRIAAGAFDYEELARRSLGKAWQGQKPAERQHFALLLRNVIEASYLPRVKGAPDFTFDVKGTEARGSSATVHVLAASQAKSVPLDFRLVSKKGRWVVYDVSVDGVSLVETYAEQFSRLLAKGGMKGLVSALEAKRAAIESQAK